MGRISLSVAVAAFSLTATLVASPARAERIHFSLAANPKFLTCLAAFPADSTRPPSAEVSVERGRLNDTLRIQVNNVKPNLAFDLFTVQNSQLLSNGAVDPNFTNFGLAWYQTDLEVGRSGSGKATIQTILLDQIFGFDGQQPGPTNTFHVGFWFNDPNDAASCGFDVTKPTPFNGEHKAGPLAMISLPDPDTGLGPLCTKPDTSTTPATCNP
jgi:hypothetical protein